MVGVHVPPNDALAQCGVIDRCFDDIAEEQPRVATDAPDGQATAHGAPDNGGTALRVVVHLSAVHVEMEGGTGAGHGHVIPPFQVGSGDEGLGVGATGAAGEEFKIARRDVVADLEGVVGGFVAVATVHQEDHVFREGQAARDGQAKPERDGENTGGRGQGVVGIVGLDARVAGEGGGGKREG